MTRRGAAFAGLVVCLAGFAGYLAAHFSRVGGNIAVVETHSSRAEPGVTQAAGSGEPQPGPSSEPGPQSGPTPRSTPLDLPDISLPDAEGVKHRLAEWRGRPLLINFWATWCEPCRREIPLLKALRRERSAQRIEVIGIAVDFGDAVRRYSREIGIDYPVLIAEQDGLDAIAAFGMDTVFPFTVFADRQGRIVTLKVGELHPEEAHLILDRIQDVDQGRINLPAARELIQREIAALAAQRAQVAEQPGVPGPQSR